MDRKFSYAMVGLFVVTLGTALVIAIIWLGAGGSSSERYQTYEVYLNETVAGLAAGAPVKYRGVDVGKIESISIDPDQLDQVRLRLEIREGTIIKQDAVATMETLGLLGINYINLTGGSADAPQLEARNDQKYPVIQSSPSLRGRVEDVFNRLSEALVDTAERVNRLLDDQNMQALSSSLANIHALTESLAAQSDKIAGGFNDVIVILENFRETSGSLPPLLEQMERSVGAVEKMSQQLSEVTDVVTETVKSTGGDVQRFTGQSLPEISAAVVELRQSAENMRRITEVLARDPSSILFGVPDSKRGPGE